MRPATAKVIANGRSALVHGGGCQSEHVEKMQMHDDIADSLSCRQEPTLCRHRIGQKNDDFSVEPARKPIVVLLFDRMEDGRRGDGRKRIGGSIAGIIHEKSLMCE